MCYRLLIQSEARKYVRPSITLRWGAHSLIYKMGLCSEIVAAFYHQGLLSTTGSIQL
jgi:hypothetical protein